MESDALSIWPAPFHLGELASTGVVVVRIAICFPWMWGKALDHHCFACRKCTAFYVAPFAVVPCYAITGCLRR